MIKTGEAPASRGGNGYWGCGFRPLYKNSTSAKQVYWRSCGVAPAAEIPGIRPVSVNPKIQPKIGLRPRYFWSHFFPFVFGYKYESLLGNG